MTNLIHTAADIRAINLVNAYVQAQNPAGIDTVEIAESDIDAIQMTEAVLHEDTGDQALRALVEEFGDDARDAIEYAFQGFIDRCVEEAEEIEARQEQQGKAAQNRLAAALANLDALLDAKNANDDEEALRAADALRDHLSDISDLNGEQLTAALDAVTHGVTRTNPEYYFNHRFGDRAQLVDSTTIAETARVEQFIEEIRAGTIDPSAWWDAAWDKEAA